MTGRGALLSHTVLQVHQPLQRRSPMLQARRDNMGRAETTVMKATMKRIGTEVKASSVRRPKGPKSLNHAMLAHTLNMHPRDTAKSRPAVGLVGIRSIASSKSHARRVNSEEIYSYLLREHLSRCHKLPEFQCPRCFERFKKKQDCLEHQRAASPCKVKDIKSFPRDLADGFDQEQYDKLEKRSTKPGHEKWASMYCILFEKTASEVPSPCEYYQTVLT